MADQPTNPIPGDPGQPGRTVSEYEQERRDKREKLRALGVDPYGSAVADLTRLADAKAQYKPGSPPEGHGPDGGPVVTIAGRVMLKRDMGKLSFITLRDDSGDLQIAVDRRRVDDLSWEVRNLTDLGDQLVATGPLGATKTGEVTVWATRLTMSSKALLPPPEKFKGLTDVEARYRQRYVDLWANPEVMRLMQLRIRIVDEIRQFMRDRGFLEVETPMMQILHGGANARPFVTHHNALNIPLFMRIAPELFLKRLLVGGFSKVFELNRNFRNEGISPRHNPEFTMLEAYQAYGSWETMADLVEDLICHLAAHVINADKPESERLIIRHPGGRVINLQRPWRRVRMVDLVAERTKAIGYEWKFDGRRLSEAAPLLHEMFERADTNDPEDLLPAPTPSLDRKDIRPRTPKKQWSHLGALSAYEQLVAIYEKLIEPTLIDPTFVTHVPSLVIPLARENRDDPAFADVYELAINGQEISPGYSELNDPDVQARHFAHQVGDKDEQQKTDDDFLTALQYGMPPAGGLGLGIDRLIMMLTGAESIRDVILFPLMKPSGEE